MFSVNLGRSIKYWLMMKGISQKELAKATCISEKSISKILNSPFCGRTENYVLICEALNITAEDLIRGPKELIMEKERAE